MWRLPGTALIRGVNSGAAVLQHGVHRRHEQGERAFQLGVEKVSIRLGTGHYVGLVDDLAFLNRPLSAEEIRVLHGLARGVAELHVR